MRRARAPHGFTVVEVLVAMGVLGIVAVGAMTLIEVVMRQGRGVIDRTESAQRGRLVLDQMTRQIRSQVCLDATTKGLIAATPNALTFFADLSAGDKAPAMRQLQYEPSTKRIVERVYRADRATIDRQSILLQNVVPTPDGSKSLPIFAYSAYPQNPPAGVALEPSDLLTGTPPGTGALSATQVARIAVVGVNFSVRPHSATGDRFNTPLSDQVVLRNADPNATKNDPTCQ
jgi:prepilin-type N-terminal cleavage/methylation domain-containing protein